MVKHERWGRWGKMVATPEAETDDKVLERYVEAMAAKGVTKMVMEIKGVQGKLIITAEPTEEPAVAAKAEALSNANGKVRAG